MASQDLKIIKFMSMLGTGAVPLCQLSALETSPQLAEVYF